MNISTTWTGHQQMKDSNNVSPRQYSNLFKTKVFRSEGNMRINTRNSFLQLSRPFRKTSTGQKHILILDLLFGTEFQKFLRKPEI